MRMSITIALCAIVFHSKRVSRVLMALASSRSWNLWFERNFRSAFRNLMISTVPITSTLNFQICTPISPAWFKFAFLMKSPSRVVCVSISRLNLLASAWLHDFEIADRLRFFWSNQKSVCKACGSTFWVTNRCALIKHSKSKRDHPKADGASASKKRDHELSLLLRDPLTTSEF